MDVWKSQSNPGKQTALAVVCVAVGLILAVGFRTFTGPGMSDSRAGFMLGLLLVFIGVAAFLVSGRQTVVIDPAARMIFIEDRNRFGSRTRTILFNTIVSVGIGFLGKKSNFVSYYYLVLRLGSGEEYPLFAPGRYYDGSSDRSVVEGWRRRLEECLRQ